MNDFIIFDTEATVWEGAFQRNWTGSGEAREIIQIGALKINRADFAMIETFEVMIKPQLNPELSQFCQDFTGITQQRIEQEGVSFAEALKQFLQFCNRAPALCHGPDGIILGENVGLCRCDAGDLFEQEFIDIKRWIHRADPELIGKRISSGNYWEYYNLPRPPEKGAHDALFDCYSLRLGLEYLCGKGHKLPF